MNVLQSGGLRTNIPATKWIILVTTDIEMLFIPNSDLDAANRFAEITVAIMRSRAFHETALNVSARNNCSRCPVNCNATEQTRSQLLKDCANLQKPWPTTRCTNERISRSLRWCSPLLSQQVRAYASV